MPAEDAAPRVLHLRSSCGFYGAEGVIYNLVRAWPGDSLTVCFEDRRDPHVELTDRLKGEGLKTATIPSKRGVDPTALRDFLRLARQYRPDIVHSHDYKSDLAAWLVGRRTGARIVSTLHGNLQTTPALRRYERLDAWLLPRFDRVAAVSEARAGEALLYGVKPDRLEVVANGVDTQLYRPLPDRRELRRSLGIPEDGLLVGVVGRLSEEKGHALLLRALVEAGETAAALRVAIIGDGPLAAELATKVSAAGLGGRVQLLGRRDDMPEVYNALDWLALPSLSEGLPMTVIEAAACGVPIVASDVGAVGTVVIDGTTGFLVPAGDVAVLGAALARIAGARRDEMGAAARQLAEREFSAGAMARAYIGLYRRALGLAVEEVVPAEASL